MATLLALPSVAAAEDQAVIRVSHGVAAPPFLEQAVPIQRRSVMELLQSVAEVDTAYGGGFVACINRLCSDHSGGKPADWFYYVNGRLASVGAAQYMPEDGDRIWWVYQSWTDPAAVPSTIEELLPEP